MLYRCHPCAAITVAVDVTPLLIPCDEAGARAVSHPAAGSKGSGARPQSGYNRLNKADKEKRSLVSQRVRGNMNATTRCVLRKRACNPCSPETLILLALMHRSRLRTLPAL
jgi:hypothetical protein